MQCPACGNIQDDNSIQCENCKMIFSRYSPPNKCESKSKFGKILKTNMIFLSVLILLILAWYYFHSLRKRYMLNSYIHSLQKEIGSKIIISPLGETESTEYIYLSGKIFLKHDASTLILKNAVISFENYDKKEKKEILSHVDGTYEINLKKDIYFLTISFNEYNLTYKEEIDLRKNDKAVRRNFTLNRN